MAKILLFCCSLIPMLAVGQTQFQTHETKYKLYLDKKEELLKSFCGEKNGYKAISEDTFAEGYKKIFSTVVLGSSDIVTNGSAVAYTQDKNKNTFSVNGSFLNHWKNWDGILNLGLILQSKDNNFNYYTKESWVNDIGFAMGYSFRISSPNQGYTQSCVELNDKRAEYLSESVRRVEGIMDEQVVLKKQRTYLSELPATSSITKEIESLDKLIATNQIKIDSLLNDPIKFVDWENKKFEKKQNFFSSYRVGG